MPNAVEVVKKAAMEAVEAGKPVHLLFGQVISSAPLKIQVDQKSTYTEKMLILTRNVTDHYVDMSVNHATNSGDRYSGRKRYRVHNGLVAGDWVVLARVQKGKRYVVLDRIKAHPALKGEWL